MSALGTHLLPNPSVGLCVCCGKTADWVRMPLGVVSEVGRGMGVLNGGSDQGDHRRKRGSFGDEFRACHCKQWGLCCVVARVTRSSQITLGRTCSFHLVIIEHETEQLA